MSNDIRESLEPKRLTIAMWDFSWLTAHYPGAWFADFDRSTDELLERDFNTVRIEAYPWIVGSIAGPAESVTIPAAPLANWGMSDRDRKHAVASELCEFLEITRRKGIHVILSTWGKECPEYPGKSPARFEAVWDATLSLLRERGMLANVLYVDLDQEFPYFSAHQPELTRLGETAQGEGMEAAGRIPSVRGLSWNDGQLDFVAQLFTGSLAHFQHEYPDLRFTFSLTGFWDECRLLRLKALDVLELHCWIHGPKFDNRTGFPGLVKDRGEHDYADYQRRIDATLRSVRPMLLHEMHRRLEKAASWGEEISAPVTTTEAWGPWWHMDHADLTWGWLREWCVECNALAREYGFWGSTPWNYSHPYWANWRDVEWYREVNGAFLRLD